MDVSKPDKYCVDESKETGSDFRYIHHIMICNNWLCTGSTVHEGAVDRTIV